jgi:hypothetical protein
MLNIRISGGITLIMRTKLFICQSRTDATDILFWNIKHAERYYKSNHKAGRTLRKRVRA